MHGRDAGSLDGAAGGPPDPDQAASHYGGLASRQDVAAGTAVLTA